MKALYNNNVVLQTDSRAHLEANYNRTIYGMTEPGTPLFYKAPQDPVERPLYVDSEGRPVPVNPATLQPMHNENGNLLDIHGELLPVTPVGKIRPHIDDVRIAVTSADFDIVDEKGDKVVIAHDGEIIPTGDDGLPGTTIVDGEVWVIGSNGLPYAPLSRVWHVNSYVNPVRAENIHSSGAGEIDHPYEEYFPIDSIVEADRPSRRGVQVAWTSSEDTAMPITTGIKAYDSTRFYVGSESMPYKYWASPGVSDVEAVKAGSTVSRFGQGWTVKNGSNVVTDTNFISADFSGVLTSTERNFSSKLTLDNESGYEVMFTAMGQTTITYTVDLLEWSATLPGSEIPTGAPQKTQRLGQVFVRQGTSVPANFNATPSPDMGTHVLRISVIFGRVGSSFKASLSDLDIRRAAYPISNVAPRAIYDRPIRTNKIVIGVEYSADESYAGNSSHMGKPSDHSVKVYADRGDGVFRWVTVKINPSIRESGHIVLYWNGSAWTEEETFGHETVIMGVQYQVTRMKRRGVRVNVMEISARYIYDVTEWLIDYSIRSDAAESSFILPFGTVNRNTGTMNLSNVDGRFNPDNKFLLDNERSVLVGRNVFTDEPNPLYQILKESVSVVIETATFAPGETEDRDYIRTVTATTDNGFTPSTEMEVDAAFSDDSKLLDRITPPPVYYSGNSMSLLQVIYTLLDTIGFTSVRFSKEDEHFATHLNHFWTEEESKSVWQVLAELCRSTQTVAWFDHNNVLNFKSLRGMYEDALTGSPAQVYSTEDISGTIANIQKMELTDTVAINKVKVNYREAKAPEKTPSGDTPMKVVWEPEGTELLRADYIRNNLNDKQVGAGGTQFFEFRSGNPKTWPFSGMVQVEGELIRYEGKEYKFYYSDGVRIGRRYIKSDDERKELDERNPELSMYNEYTGRMRIVERGAEGTLIKPHAQKTLGEFTVRFNNGTSATTNNYRKGVSIKDSRVFIVAQGGTKSAGTTTVSTGSSHDERPRHIGTRLRINAGANAGVCFVGGPRDDGVYVELTTTEGTEAAGRIRGELHCFVKINGKVTFHGLGQSIPISKFRDYDLDVTIAYTTKSNIIRSFLEYYDVQLKFGDRGNYVSVLQGALNEHKERLVIDGIFGQKTKDAVMRFQRKRNLTRDGVVNIEEWKELEYGGYVDGGSWAVQASVDGVHHSTTYIPLNQLPTTRNEGRYGVFTRGKSSASFEYLYGAKGNENVDFDNSNFFDYVKGGYVSNQLEAGWIYRTSPRWVIVGGKKVLRDVVTNQLMMTDFGAYAHEVRDYDVVFNSNEQVASPAIASYLYHSNDIGAHLVDYKHTPFGAKFRLANKRREAVVLNGEDTSTFGSEESVEQRMMVYGNVLDISDERRVEITNTTSTAARGVEEMTIDVDWIQSKEAAEKLGSHIVEAMSSPVPTYELSVFGNASARVGQIVSLYNPQAGVGSGQEPEEANRYFVYGVDQNNNGGQTTTLRVREVIGSTGIRNATLRDVFRRNNNAANMNWDMAKSKEISPRRYVPDGYIIRDGLRASHTTGYTTGNGAAWLTSQGGDKRQTQMLATPFPDGIGRMAYNYGNYYLAYATVRALSDCGVQVAVEGHGTSSNYIKDVAAQIRGLKAGETRKVIIKGRYLDTGVPEIQPVLRVLSPTNHAHGAPVGTIVIVDDFYYRDSQDADSIYPLHGGEEFRNL